MSKHGADEKPVPLQNWDIDIWYAAAVLLIGGFAGHILTDQIMNTMLADISVSIVSLALSLSMPLVFSWIIKNYYFKDEQKQVNSTPVDLVFCIAVVIGLAYVCRDMIGPSYLLMALFASVGMVVDYLGLVKKILGTIKKKMSWKK